MRESIVLVGAGGLGREVLEAIRACDGGRRWDVVGFLDDASDAPSSIAGVPLLGPTSGLAAVGAARVLLCVAHPDRPDGRAQLQERLALDRSRAATIVHPAASLGASVRVGAGSVVLAGCVATADVEIADHVVVMPACVFTHDDRIESFATFGAGVRLAGNVTVRRSAYVGSGALVRQGVTIGESAVIGMGSVVLEDVPDREVWVGAPAHRLRNLDS